MRLDRNVNGNGRQKYGLVKNRRLQEIDAMENAAGFRKQVADAVELLIDTGVLDWGDAPETEFFAIKLRDRHARAALLSYAGSVDAHSNDVEYCEDVLELARRAGPHSRFCKVPD